MNGRKMIASKDQRRRAEQLATELTEMLAELQQISDKLAQELRHDSERA
jgi:hypothetical protein